MRATRQNCPTALKVGSGAAVKPPVVRPLSGAFVSETFAGQSVGIKHCIDPSRDRAP